MHAAGETSPTGHGNMKDGAIFFLQLHERRHIFFETHNLSGARAPAPYLLGSPRHASAAKTHDLSSYVINNYSWIKKKSATYVSAN